MLSLLNHRWVVVALTLAAAVVRFWDPAPIAGLRLYAFDTYQRLAPRAYDPGLPIRIVDIDEAALEADGQWPWPRTRLAELTSRLYAMGAVVVAFDFIFAEPDRTSPEQLIADLPDMPEAGALAEKVLAGRSHDEAFADALAAGPAVLGAILNASSDTTHRARAGFAHAGDDPRQFAFAFSGAAGNIAVIEERAAGLGALNWVPDADQIVRRIPVVASLGDELFPALSAEMMRVAQGAGTYVIRSSGASGEEAFGEKTGMVAIKTGDLEIPVTAAGEMWIHYAGTTPERYVSARDVLHGADVAGKIAGHLVVVGTSAAGLFDIRATPLDAAVPGVEVHAEAIEQMLTDAFLIRPDFALAAEVAYLVALGFIVAFLIGRIGPQWTGVVALALIVAANAVSWYAFTEHGWLVDPVYPTLMGAVVYVFGTLTGYLRTEIERDRVRNAFGHYLSPTLVEELAGHPERLSLGGEMREVTILFTDIRGFTGIAEQFSASELTQFLNRFLTPMTDAVLAHGGTIDKYMGDAIMAFWNAPLDDGRHAERACLAALEMNRRLAALNAELAGETGVNGRPIDPVRIGIGINTGECCVGNLGSQQRFAYSVIGDDVNVASRLEGQSKQYGTPIVIGESTARKAGDLAFLELDLVRVYGRRHPVRLFTLLGDSETASGAPFRALAEAHAAMLAAFRDRKWTQSARRLVDCESLDDGPMAPVYRLYRERIARFRNRPPARGWDGVETVVTK